MRIPAYRPGYGYTGRLPGYDCVGLAYTVLPALDCGPDNYYLKLPPLAEGGVTDTGWEALALLDNDSRLRDYHLLCGWDYDPFEGDMIDLYLGFEDNLLTAYIEDDCYDPGAEYAQGFLNPAPAAPAEGCGDCTGAGGGLI